MKILSFILGTIMGSFYLVLGTRLPKNEDIVKSRSRCDNCKKVLKWYNLIPLVSFIVQRGKCSSCGQKISSEHFFAEIFTGLLFLLTSIYFSFGYNYLVGLIIVSLMVIIFISDFKYMIILDSPLVVSVVLIIILKLIYFGFKTTIYSIISGLILFLIMLLIENLGSLILKKDSLGGGDIKFAFLMGLTLDVKLGIVALVLSTFLALPYAVASVKIMKSHEFPYGPFLAGALFIVFFHLDKFTNLINFLFAI
ncbi:prepilin peptidase [bacterium]|nr:prepilin peptidase [bacterium]